MNIFKYIYLFIFSMKRRDFIIAITSLALASIAGGVIYFDNEGNKYCGEVKIIDSMGRTVYVPKEINKVVALGPGTLGMIIYAGGLDKISGIEQIELRNMWGQDCWLAYHDKFKGLPIVGQGGPNATPDPSAILTAKPQVIIEDQLYAQVMDPNQLQEETKIPVIVVYTFSPKRIGELGPNTFKSSMSLLGELLGTTDRTNELNEYVNSLVNDLNSRTSNISYRPSVYVGGLPYKTGSEGFLGTDVDFEVLNLINTKSVVDNLGWSPGFYNIDFSYLLRTQPEFVFIDEGNLETVISEFSQNKQQFCSLNAFKNGNVYGLLPYRWYQVNVTNQFLSAYYIGKNLYPDNFTDVDIFSLANEIYIKFLGINIYSNYLKYAPGYVNISGNFQC
ncbi:ABC transporter substrate-binding protein [Acidianus brierleyi]|uniref:Iron ABC transporter substrate-binding protein n=2 Tax=Acidianus brierleyi TaxID=41673 RepID=A0A2U9ICW6_9CREN|nr:ABC transporter substrate-binding protein [Acidianus brierleyi]